MALVVNAFDGSFLEGAVHPPDQPIGSRVVVGGQASNFICRGRAIVNRRGSLGGFFFAPATLMNAVTARLPG